jgi:hypothetical protein
VKRAHANRGINRLCELLSNFDFGDMSQDTTPVVPMRVAFCDLNRLQRVIDLSFDFLSNRFSRRHPAQKHKTQRQ